MDLLCYNYATVHRKEEHFNENGMHLSCPGEKLNSVHLVGRPEFELLDYRSTEVIFPMLSIHGMFFSVEHFRSANIQSNPANKSLDFTQSGRFWLLFNINTGS